jgi:hypothetical protein
MKESFRDHPSEEALERFLLNTLHEEETESLETHVLACESCVEQLETLETQIAATRFALRKLEARQFRQRTAGKSGGWKRWFTIPSLSFAAGASAAAAGALLFSIPRDVTITAFRGTETAIVSEGRPLRMHLHEVRLNPGTVAIELADHQGSVVWQGTSVVRHDQIEVTLPRITHSGAHFLRLYSTLESGSPGVLLREFSLNAQRTL